MYFTLLLLILFIFVFNVIIVFMLMIVACYSWLEPVIGWSRLRSLNIHQLRRRSIQWLPWRPVSVCYRWHSVLPVKQAEMYSTAWWRQRLTVCCYSLITWLLKESFHQTLVSVVWWLRCWTRGQEVVGLVVGHFTFTWQLWPSCSHTWALQAALVVTLDMLQRLINWRIIIIIIIIIIYPQ